MIPKFPRGFSHPMRIGRGAFASVYRVRQPALDRWVAVKFIYEKNASKRQELLKEAQTQAKMHAECVPQIFDAFEWRQNICMVMEWVRGVSLAALLERELTVEQRVALAGTLIRAMAIIHGKGFAHRDLKPENVIVTSDRGLFLVDFGFSKSVTDQQASSVTTAKGTPAYMAPELWSKGSNVDLMRADIYAVGKILVQILSATPYTSITESLLKDDPSLRPPSGIDLLLLWENGGTAVHAAADWKRMVGDLTAETLSHDLLNAAKKLLYAHRNDEAYWLLVESLEENGDNREAIELMGSFQNRSRKRAGIYHYLFFALVLVVGVLLAFMAGTKSSSRIVSTNDALKKERTSLLSSPNDGSAIAGDLTLREDTVHTDKLSGRLVVRNVPEDAQLYIDAKIADSDSAGEPGYFLHWGEHVVFLNDTTGRMLSRCIVKLLPFQTKAIDLSVQIAETEREY